MNEQDHEEDDSETKGQAIHDQIVSLYFIMYFVVSYCSYFCFLLLCTSIIAVNYYT